MLTPKDAGSRCTVRVGDEIEVTLPETVTTGYRWRAQLDGDLLEQIGELTNARTMPRGAPGTRTLTFHTVRPGQAVLRLVHSRPWEREPVDEFTVQLDIGPNE